ncbi:hypothetical protein V2J09_022976 [Rumex salicifolius]
MLCLLKGRLEKLSSLKQQYALGKTTTEVNIVIEELTLLIRSLLNSKGSLLSFSLTTLQTTPSSPLCYQFGVTWNGDGSISLYWGTDSEGHLVISEDFQTTKHGCGKSFEHPNKDLKPMPWVDSWGQVCGSTFIVDSDTPSKQGGLEVRQIALLKFDKPPYLKIDV